MIRNRQEKKCGPAFVAWAVVVSCSALVTFAGCSGANKSDGKGASGKSDGGSEVTSSTAQDESHGQVEYFSEKYLSSSERLTRREGRIKDVLK